MSRIRCFAVAAAVLAAWAGLRISRQSNAQVSPEDTIYALENAARAGAVTAYLEAFAEPMQSRLRSLVAESGAERFASTLRESSQDAVGLVLSDPRDAGGQETAVRVERVYADHNSSQTVYLVRTRRGWKVSRTGEDQTSNALVPYGTPVRFH